MNEDKIVEASMKDDMKDYRTKFRSLQKKYLRLVDKLHSSASAKESDIQRAKDLNDSMTQLTLNYCSKYSLYKVGDTITYKNYDGIIESSEVHMVWCELYFLSVKKSKVFTNNEIRDGIRYTTKSRVQVYEYNVISVANK